VKRARQARAGHQAACQAAAAPAASPDAKASAAGPSSRVMPLKKDGFDQLFSVQALATAKTQVILAIMRHPSPAGVQALPPLPAGARRVLPATGITDEILTALSGAGYASDASDAADIPGKLYTAVTRQARQTGRSQDGRAPQAMLPSREDMTARPGTGEGKKLHRRARRHHRARLRPGHRPPRPHPALPEATRPAPGSPSGAPATTSSRPSPHGSGASPARPAPPPPPPPSWPPPDPPRKQPTALSTGPGHRDQPAGRAISMPGKRPLPPAATPGTPKQARKQPPPPATRRGGNGPPTVIRQPQKRGRDATIMAECGRGDRGAGGLRVQDGPRSRGTSMRLWTDRPHSTAAACQ
jgi:hypothetical protein